MKDRDSKRLVEEIIFRKDVDFTAKALELFHFQHEHNPIYKQYCSLLNRPKASISCIEEIPFLPISFFKSKVISTVNECSTFFESSGTTADSISKHYVPDLYLYEKSFFNGFHHFYDAVEDYTVIALLPSYLERSNSSLIYMVDAFIKKSRFKESGFFLYDYEQLHQLLNELAVEQRKVLLIGVSFALLDFAKNYRIQSPNPQLVVMETGGMKGRGKELVREELHAQLTTCFKVDQIHSEYGMTELLSQAYSKSKGLFETPPWMKVMIREQDNPFSYCKVGETGGINIIDLANLYSCSFIQTDDLGRLNNKGQFEVLGRFDSSDIRGCNLMIA